MHFLCCENGKNMWASCFWSKIIQKISNYLKFFCQNNVLTVDSGLSCSKNVWFRSKNARFCSKFFSRLMLEILPCSKCSTIFLLKIAWMENSKSKIVLKITRIENFKARKTSMFLQHFKMVGLFLNFIYWLVFI